jgi:peroxiredoxin
VRRHRPSLTIALAGAVAVVVVVGVVALITSPAKPPRPVTIPVADRNASPALIRAAEAVGFRPAATSGSVENEPAFVAPPPSSGLLPLGTQAPGFSLRTPAGTPFALASTRGKAVLLEFFATWCPHCGAEAPHLRSLYDSFPKTRVAFAAVNGDSEDAASVFAYHVYFGLPFPALLDPGNGSVTWPDHGRLGPVTETYGVSRFPTFFVLDRAGRIAWRGDGEQPDALLRSKLRQAAGL